MNNKGLYQTGLVFSLLTALGWILFVAGMITRPGTGGLGPLEAYLTNAQSSAALLYTWGGILGSLGVVPVILAIYLGFNNRVGSILIVPVTFAIIGVIFLTLGFMVDTGSEIYHFGPALAGYGGENAEILVQSAQLAQDSIEVTWAVGSMLAYGATISWIAILLLRAGSVPRWVNWTGIIGGICGMFWAFNFLPISAPQIAALALLMLNIVLVMIWLIGISIGLAKEKY